MAVAPPPPISPPSIAPAAEVARFWTNVDRRISLFLSANQRRLFGIPRPRTMTINVPIAGTTPPVAGWLASVVVDTPIRIVGWQIHAIIQGSVQIDVRQSQIQTSVTTPSVITSMVGLGTMPTLVNGYTASSLDTSAWASREMPPGILNFYVMSATTIGQAILGLQVIDMSQKMLQV